MNPAMRPQYHNVHHQNAQTPLARRPGGMAPIALNSQSQNQPQYNPKQAHIQQANRELRELEMAQRRAHKPTDKNMPEGIDKITIGDGVQQYKRVREVERRLDAIMMRKRLDLLDKKQHGTKRYKTMRIWISNTVDLQPWQGSRGEDDGLYDFSGTSEGLFRMKIEGRLLDDKDDGLSDDEDSDIEQETQDGEAMEQDKPMPKKSVKPGEAPPKTKLSHFFKAITVEFDRNKNIQAEFPAQAEWKRPHYNADSPPPPGADFDSLEFERKGDSDINCTVHLYRDDERFLLSDALAEILDSKEEDRETVMSGIWDYIKAMNLLQDDEKRAVQCDDRLRKIFDRDVIFIPDLPALLSNSHHLFPLPPISLPYTIRCDLSFHTSASDPPPPTIYDLTLLASPPPSHLNNESKNNPLPTAAQLSKILHYDNHLGLLVQAIQHSKSKHAFLMEFERDPVGFLKRWMGSQRRDLEVLVGDGVGMGRGEWGVGEGYGVGEEWRRGGAEGVWGRDEVRESVKLMRDRG